MKATDRKSFDAITQHMSIYALRAYEGVVALMIADYQDHRCVFPAAIMEQKQQEETLSQPGNRALTWINILSNMSLAMDSQDVFNADILNGFVQTILREVEALRNPFTDKVAEHMQDVDDEDEDDGEDDELEVPHVNEAIQSLVTAIYHTDNPVMDDDAFKEPHEMMETFVQHVRFDADNANLMIQIAELFEQSMAVYRSRRTNIRKEKMRKRIDKEMNAMTRDSLMTLAHVIYSFAHFSDPKVIMAPTQAITFAVAIFGTVAKFGLGHITGRLTSCLVT